MPKINVNLDEVKDYVEPGWYFVTIVGAEIKDSQSSDSQYINWRLQIDEPESEFHKQSLFHMTSLKQNALPMLKNFLEAAGVEWGEDSFNTEDAIGAQMEVKVDVEQYKGRMQNRIKNFRSV